MIASIKAEIRKSVRRPALLIGSGLVAGIVVLVYGVLWYQSAHPSSAEHPVSILALYPENFVSNVIGAGYPLGAALTILLGALIGGSEYSWGTMKTLFTQGPGRLTVWAGRTIVFMTWTALMSIILFAVGAACSVVVASFQGHAISWPASIDILKGLGAIWLIFSVNGALGLALGVLVRQSAAALGIGIVYLLGVEGIIVRFIDGLNNGAYKWFGDLFVGQNSAALLQSFSPRPAGSISAEQAVLVLVAFLVALLVVAGGLQRMRDVT
ncbi:MAG TPA: ABC transporter permease [Candidatus Dormibacteraeota bacterium]|nr:ABC transporter permease [Candidatus Dormibacteraeota bacterium]